MVPGASHPTHHVGVPIQGVLVEEGVQDGEPGEDAETTSNHPAVEGEKNSEEAWYPPPLSTPSIKPLGLLQWLGTPVLP